MQSDATKTVRSVVPRWRSLSETPGYELIAHRKPRQRNVVDNSLADRLQQQIRFFVDEWKEKQDLISAADLLDAAIVFNVKEIAAEAAKFVASRSSNAVPSLRSAAAEIANNSFWNEGDCDDKALTKESAIRDRIKILKRRSRESPRDSISTVELARMYALIGQREKTEKALERAVKASPNNRYVLRSVTQFFSTCGNYEKGLHYIWKSDAVRHDAWIQSAEVALIAQTSKPLRYAGKKKRALVQQKHLDEGNGELAVGLAGLEFANGANKKHVRRLVDNSLSQPTENGLAQAIWIGEHANFQLPTHSLLKKTPRAHEAEYYSLIDGSYFDHAVIAAKRWHDDQPLSADAAIAGMYTYSILMGKYDKAIAFAASAERSHRSHFMLNNSKMVAQALGGKVKDALFTLHRMEHLKKNKADSMFVEAGRGLTHFQLGNFELGRNHYQETIRLAKSLSDHGAQVRAYIFWLEQEVTHGCMGNEEYFVVSAEIEKVIKRVPLSSKKDLSRLWAIRRQFIDEVLAQQSLWTVAHKHSPIMRRAWQEIDSSSTQWN